MKKIFVVLMAVLMVLGLVGCEEKIKLVSDADMKMVNEVTSRIYDYRGVKEPKFEEIKLDDDKLLFSKITYTEAPKEPKKGDTYNNVTVAEFTWNGKAHTIKTEADMKFDTAWTPVNKYKGATVYLDGRKIVFASTKNLVLD